VLVTSPDPLAIGEARFFSDKLQEAGMNRKGIIVNQVHALIDEPSVPADEQVAALRDVLPDSIDAADILPRLSEALAAERGWAIADRIQVERLSEQVDDDARIVEVPAFDQDVHDLAALAKVASFLTVTT
jgi:anion-transporting  ArsA/GET3 family ATPase